MLRCGCRDDERQRIEKLEQDLAAADPELNLKLQSGSPKNTAARTVYGVLTVLRPHGGYRGDDHSAADLGRCRIPGNGPGGAHWALAGLRQHPGPM